jgi:hypothetical protein
MVQNSARTCQWIGTSLTRCSRFSVKSPAPRRLPEAAVAVGSLGEVLRRQQAAISRRGRGKGRAVASSSGKGGPIAFTPLIAQRCNCCAPSPPPAAPPPPVSKVETECYCAGNLPPTHAAYGLSDQPGFDLPKRSSIRARRLSTSVAAAVAISVSRWILSWRASNFSSMLICAHNLLDILGLQRV